MLFSDMAVGYYGQERTFERAKLRIKEQVKDLNDNRGQYRALYAIVNNLALTPSEMGIFAEF